MSRAKALKLSPEQGKLVREVISESGRKVLFIADKSGIDRTHLNFFMSGKKGLTHEKVVSLYAVLNYDERLSFMQDFMQEFAQLPHTSRNPITKPDIETGWFGLYDSYNQTLRYRFATSPIEVRQNMISDLEELTKKYLSKEC